MNKEYFNKDIFLIILFSLSIFLSYTSIYNLEFRFLYLISLPFIFFDKQKLKTFFTSNNFLISSLLIFCIYFYSSFFYFFEFKNFVSTKFNFELIINELNIKTLGQVIIFGITLLIIFFYKNLIVKNLTKLADFFVVSFVVLIIIYNFNKNNILVDTLFSCNLGFFYYTRFLFFENSHFAVVSATIITYFFFYIKDYFNKKILFCFYILFFIFSIGSMTITLTFFLCMMLSILTSLIFCRKKENYSIYFLIILLIFVNLNFFYGKNFFLKLNTDRYFSFDPSKKRSAGSEVFYSISPTNFKSQYCSVKNNNVKNKIDLKSRDLFKGSLTYDKSKLNHILRKDVVNLSVGIQLYSLYFAKNTITKYPFGVGLNNYSNFREVFDKDQVIEGEKPYQKIIFNDWFFKSMPAIVLDFNKNSGSNNFSKLIVEFGILGLILLIIIFYMLCSNKIDNSVKIIFLTLFVNQLLIRGTGYFNNGFLIIIIFLILIFFDKQSKKKVKVN